MKNKTKFKKISFICFLVAMLVLSLLCIPLVRGYNNIATIEGFVQRFGLLSVFALLFIQILQIVVALIPGEVIEFAAGALFGPLWGTLICMAGMFLGQWLIFTMVIKWGDSVLSAVLDKKFIKKFKFLQNKKKVKVLTFITFHKNSVSYILNTCRLSVRRRGYETYNHRIFCSCSCKCCRLLIIQTYF